MSPLQHLKKSGNEHYSKEQYQEAIDRYSLALIGDGSVLPSRCYCMCVGWEFGKRARDFRGAGMYTQVINTHRPSFSDGWTSESIMGKAAEDAPPPPPSLMPYCGVHYLWLAFV